ncbi:MAG TPA: glycoside hydrolase family 76 protein [Gaiellaceae bacterium]|nr:glycoside hydrolase family 76 protein [Gaiellaceae bacterium]
MVRVFRLWRLVAAAFIVLLSTAAGYGSASRDSARADHAYRSMERVYLDPGHGDFRQTPGGRVGSHAWPFSQALAATIEMARLRGVRSVPGHAVHARLTVLDRRFRAHGVYRAKPGGDVYYDDNEWIAQDLLDWDAVRGSVPARRKAARIFEAVTRAWDNSPRKTCPGGIQWTDARGNDDRNTVSTANGAIVGLRLYLLTRRPAYLRWAERMVGWVEQCLHDPDGLYGDHISGDGRVDRTEWSYNQGSMIETYRLLYRATGNRADLANAEALADSTLAAFHGRWTREPSAFAAIFFRRLLALAGVDRRRAYVTAAQRYADRLWARPRHQLFDQAALVQLYAALAARDGE